MRTSAKLRRATDAALAGGNYGDFHEIVFGHAVGGGAAAGTYGDTASLCRDDGVLPDRGAPSTSDVREVNDVEAFAIDRVSAGFGFNTRGSRVRGERGTA
jgi:hypothetical protein